MWYLLHNSYTTTSEFYTTTIDGHTGFTERHLRPTYTVEKYHVTETVLIFYVVRRMVILQTLYLLPHTIKSYNRSHFLA